MSQPYKHILVIRLSAMGDVAMLVPVLKAMQEQHPEVKLTVLSKPFFEPIFSNLPNVSFYSAQVKTRHKGIAGLYKLYKELKALKIDAVADMHNVLRSNVLKQFFSLSRIPVRQINKGRKEKKALTRAKNKIFKPLQTTHERYADVFRELGFTLQLKKEHILPKPSLTPKITNLLGAEPKKWIGIAPFAAFSGKTYPMHLMKQVVSNLAANNTYKVVLFGGPNDVNKLKQLKQEHNNVLVLAGKTSFKEELILIANLDVMLSMDSGNAHLAAMFGVPTVTLWGVTHPYAGFYPFAQNPNNALLADRTKFPAIPTSVYGNKMPENYDQAMATITPEMVVKKVTDLL